MWLTPSLLWAAPHAVSPFQQLVAALDCDEIVGKDFSTDSMDMQELRMFVESPMLEIATEWSGWAARTRR